MTVCVHVPGIIHPLHLTLHIATLRWLRTPLHAEKLKTRAHLQVVSSICSETRSCESTEASSTDIRFLCRLRSICICRNSVLLSFWLLLVRLIRPVNLAIQSPSSLRPFTMHMALQLWSVLQSSARTVYLYWMLPLPMRTGTMDTFCVSHCAFGEL